MTWTSDFFARLSQKEESAQKEVFDAYFETIYNYIYWLTSNKECAKEISLDTLVTLCRNKTLHNDLTVMKDLYPHGGDVLQPFIRFASTMQCISYFKRWPWRRKRFRAYLENDDKSMELFAAAWENAERMQTFLPKWKELPPDQRKTILQSQAEADVFFQSDILDQGKT